MFHILIETRNYYYELTKSVVMGFTTQAVGWVPFMPFLYLSDIFIAYTLLRANLID